MFHDGELGARAGSENGPSTPTHQELLMHTLTLNELVYLFTGEQSGVQQKLTVRVEARPQGLQPLGHSRNVKWNLIEERHMWLEASARGAFSLEPHSAGS